MSIKDFNKRRCIRLVMLAGWLFALVSTPHSINAVDLNSGEVIDELEESTNELEQTDESILEENDRPVTLDTQKYYAILPFSQFMNYQYIGQGQAFINKNIILEYRPDDQGIFQVAEFTDQKAVAYIYQIRADGLYELACIDPYDQVQDLRYSPQASGASASLILPARLAVGSHFRSGYQNEKSLSFIKQVDQVAIGSTVYSNVVVLEETQDGMRPLRYYYADKVGLILVQELESDGQEVTLMYLNATQGELAE